MHLSAPSAARPRVVRVVRVVRGLSLVELLVGIAIGLFIVAAASLVLSTQLIDNRRLQVEVQLQQDLRAAADIVARELRRAGYWGDAARGTWHEANPAPLANPYETLSTATADTVTFASSRAVPENNALDANERFGFRISDGTLQSLLGLGAGNAENWQALTDRSVMRVTALTITPTTREGQALVCPTSCPVAVPGLICPPRVEVREMSVQIDAQAANDASVRRTVRTTVRLRNDAVRGSCPA